MNERASLLRGGGIPQLLMLLAAALSAVVPAPAARAADPVVAPGAGTLLQQAQPVKPAVPSAAATGLSIEQANGAQLPPSAPFAVNNIQITGNAAFDTATLHALVADSEGKSLTLLQCGEVVARITEYYHRHGYPLARAIIPAQTIQSGVVKVLVVEARYGAIGLDNRSRVQDPLLRQTLSTLQAGQTVSQAQLDHTLLLMSDIPGVAVVATLRPGDAVGTSDLWVQSGATAPVTASVTLDNDGDRYTGRTRAAATVNVIDPLRHGDILSLALLSSGSDMNYGSLAYEAVLNGVGTRVGASYSALHYVLGDTLAPLDAHGTAEVAGAWIKQPLIRAVDANLYGQIRYDHKRVADDIDATGLKTERHLDNWSAALNGDWRDAALAGGAGTWNIGYTTGRVDFDNSAAERSDSATANTRGRFSKWNGNVAHLLNVTHNNTLYLALSGQWVDGNLDASEKMVAGGPYSVRAYDVDAISGDSGLLGSIELRHNLGQILDGQLLVLGFADCQRVTVNKNPWVSTVNNATLSGAGLGINWAGPHQWLAKTSIAVPIGSTPVLVGANNSVRVWVELDKGF
jgi:hemolysin activation/secretion protein